MDSFISLALQHDWTFEILFIALFVIIYIFYSRGSKKNEDIATQWFSSISPALSSQFSRLTSDAQGNVLICDSSDIYYQYSTGCKFANYQLTTLRLLNRHDPIRFFYDLYYNNCDSVKIKLSVPKDRVLKGVIPHLTFAVVAKRSELKTVGENYSLGKFGRKVINCPIQLSQQNIEQNLVFYTDSVIGSEILTTLLTEKLLKGIAVTGSSFRSLVIYDGPKAKPETEEDWQECEKNNEFIVEIEIVAKKLKLSAGDSTAWSDFQENTIGSILTSLSNQLSVKSDSIDKLKKVRLAVKEESLKEYYKMKSEEYQQKRAAEKRKEAAEMANKSSAAQKKFDEKEYKKQLKKKMKVKTVR